VCGLIVQVLPKFQSEELENKVSFLWQVHGVAESEEEGATPEPLIKYVKSVPYKISSYQKAGLMKMLMKWSKANTPEEVIEKLKDPESGVFNLEILLGKKATLTIAHKIVKDKTYAEIDSIGVPKKSQPIEFDETQEIPMYIHSPKTVPVEAKYLPNAKFSDVVIQHPKVDTDADLNLGTAPVVNSGDDEELPF
jgi:hypothetical protein